MNIRDTVTAYTEELITLRRDFHAYPELGFQEFRTAEVVEQYLQALGLETVRCAGTGVTAVLEGRRPSPVLLLRADMDALPLQEENTFSYASKHHGVMHACGHDAHMAMMLVTAKILCQMRESMEGTVKFVFQPNEEIAGAEAMIEQGVLERPRADAAMGLHIWTPLPSGSIGIKAGAVTASMDVFSVRITGKGGHTGYPESAVDPVIAAADVVQSVQRIQTRLISPMKSTVIMFGKIQGGTKNNIIPDEVVLEGTIRYLYAASPDQNPTEQFRSLVSKVCSLHRCSCSVHIEHENDAVVNSSMMASLANDAAKEIVGEDQVVEHASMACEDFSAFADRVPSVFAFIGTAREEAHSTYPHHNPRFTIDEQTLSTGVEFLVSGALKFFQRNS